MKIANPEEYIGRRLKVTLRDGSVIVGCLYGFDYDFDDDGREFLEFDVEEAGTGIIYSTTEETIVKIE